MFFVESITPNPTPTPLYSYPTTTGGHRLPGKYSTCLGVYPYIWLLMGNYLQLILKINKIANIG